MATVHRIPAGLPDGHGGSLFPFGWWFGPDSLCSLLPLSRQLWGASQPAGRIRKQQQGLVHSWGAGVRPACVFSLQMSHLHVLDCMIRNNWGLICNLYCGWSNQVSFMWIYQTDQKSLELMIYSFLGNSCCRMFSSKYVFIHYLNEQI